MAAFTRQYLNQPVAPAGGALVALATAAAFLLMPAPALEDLAWRSGIAALMPVAAPPLGVTARAVLALGGATLAGAVAWAALFLLFGPGGFFDMSKAVKAIDEDVPTVRKADAHPDAPARKPLSARDLGAPMPPIVSAADPAAPMPPIAPPPVIQPVPADLDQPLSAFHPAAVRDDPLEPVRPVMALRPPVPLSLGERMTSVELPRLPSNDADAPSIESLLRRLEQGARQRAGAR